MSGERPRSTASATAVIAVATFAVALALRLAVAGDLLAADPLVRRPVLDDREYLAMAGAMAEGRAEPWFFAPLYPWMLSVAAKAGALAMPLACRLNAVLGAATAALLAVAGCRLASRTAGAVAGAVYALAGAFVFHDALPGQETALSFLSAAVVLAALRMERGARGGAVLVGVLTGVAVLGRGTSIALLFAAVPALSGRPRTETLRSIALCAAGLAAVLVPATLRNATVAGDRSPLPWARGPNLYAANGPDARATTSFGAAELSGGAAEMALRAVAVAEAKAGRALTKGEVSSWWSDRAWRERGDLGPFAVHTAKKAALFLAADERGSNHSIRAESRYSLWLAATPLGAWWILVLGTAGWWIARRAVPRADGVALAIAGTWLLLALAFPVARFRLPAAALATLLVGCGAAEVLRRAVKARAALEAAAVAILGTAIAFLPLREPAEGLAHVNLAMAHLSEGDGRAAADAELSRALAAEPACGPALEMMGRLALDDGDAARAYDLLARAATDRRSRYSAQVAAIAALAALARNDEAVAVARGLLGERTDDPELLANAALAESSHGDRAAAARLLAAARALAPSHPAVLRAASASGL